MSAQRRALLFLLAPAVLTAFGATVPVSAAAPNSPTHARMDRLAVYVTTSSGIVWGRVTTSYTYQRRTVSVTHSTPSFLMQVPHGTFVRLFQTPANAVTWPFRGWQVRWGSHVAYSANASTVVHMTGAVTVSAVYVYVPMQSSPPMYQP